MSKNAAPLPGDMYLRFNGLDAFVEIASIEDYSVSTTAELTISAWMRPDTLNFPSVEVNTDYIEWLGKGGASGDGGNQEWTFRMYNHHDPLDNPSRQNRISFYVFNPQGGLGVGSYVQVPIHIGRWIHVVGIADSTRTYFYFDGQFIRCDTYRGPAEGSCEVHYLPPPNEHQQLTIDPQAGSAPLRLGSKGLGSFFEGGLTRVRLWSRALTADEVAALYATDATPMRGLVGEFLLNADTGAEAIDSSQGNNGRIRHGTWAIQG